MNTRLTAMASFILLLLLLCFSFFIKLSSIPIRIWDEARLANSALDMHLHGHWLIPYYDGAPDMWSVKPPLMIWLQAISIKIFGINEFAVRFPSALSSVSIGLLLWWFCKKKFGNYWFGFIVGIVFAATYTFVYLHAGRSGDYDALLVLFICLYCLSIYQFSVQPEIKWSYSFFVFLTLAALTKGIAALLVLPGFALFIIFFIPLRKFIWSKHFFIGSGIFLFFVLGYYLLREHFNPGYLKAVWQNELGGRYLSTLEQHQHPFGYYYENFSWRYPYWRYFLLPSFVIGLLLQRFRKLTLFNLLVTVPYFLVISLAKTKLEWYDLPLYPFFSLQIGVFIFACINLLFKASMLSAVIKYAVSFFLVALLFYKPFQSIYRYIFNYKEQEWDVDPHRESHLIKNAMNEGKDLSNYTFVYDDYYAQIKFYIKKLNAEGVPVRFATNIDSLKAGDKVVISQPHLKQKIDSLFINLKVEDKSGSTVYELKQKR
jgi:4-amino-4-deoxy-L-arabinose transferase-like glycosyltransferase